MHDINYFHEHELEDRDFRGCCKNCLSSLAIIKPHILAFAERIRKHSRETLAALEPDELYRLYQLLDDLAHLNTGDHLAELVLNDPDVRAVLPVIRSYYAAFFDIHETRLAKKILESPDPWNTLGAFPLLPRYETLVRRQVEAAGGESGTRVAFVGSGPVPLSLILLCRGFRMASIGLDTSEQAVDLSRRVIRRLGLEGSIEIVQGDETRLADLEWDSVLVAALAEPKTRIFRNIRRALETRGNRASVVFRTYSGMRAVLYEPVQPCALQGFRITRKIFPEGRVNNTLVLVEPV